MSWVLDIVVVGAGIVGLSTARALQRSGHRVTVLDRDEPGQGCSFGNAGHIAIDHVIPLARLSNVVRAPAMLLNRLGPLTIKAQAFPALVPWIARFLRASLPDQFARGTKALGELLGQSRAAWVDEVATSDLDRFFRTDGALLVYESERAFAKAAGDRKTQQAHGVRVETIDGDEARRLAPGLGPAIKRATVFPDDGHVIDPLGVVRALAEAFAKDGGRLEKSTVTGFEAFENAVFAVKTEQSARPADVVVLAAGVETRAIAAMFGLHLPLAAERGYHLMLDRSQVGFDIAVTSAERSFVMTPMLDGFRLAGTVEFARPDDPPTWERAEILARHLRVLFPEIQPRELSRWMGRRPTLPDFLPAIGRAPGLANVLIATGHQHLGLTLAPITARLIDDLVAGRPPRVDLAPFDPGRFN